MGESSDTVTRQVGVREKAGTRGTNKKWNENEVSSSL